MSRDSVVYLLSWALVFMVGIYLVREKDAGPTQVGIGTSLIAAGIAGWVVFAHVWITQENRDRERLVSEFGLVGAFEGRGVRIKSEYDLRIKRASDSIDVMGFGLAALREDYGHEFAAWSTRLRVRVLVIDPEYPQPGESGYAAQRDREEKDGAGRIAEEVKQFIRQVAPLTHADARRRIGFEVRLYRCLPSVNVFRVDDEMFWGPYLMQGPSRNTMTLIARRGGPMFRQLQGHFDTIWSSPELSRPVPSTWLQ